MELISEEEALAASQEVSREVQRNFTGIPHHIVRGALALISLFIIYSTINMGFDVVIKYASYLMLMFVMTAVVYPFRKKGKLTRLSVPDVVIIILSIAGSIYVMYDYNSRFMRLGMLSAPDIVEVRLKLENPVPAVDEANGPLGRPKGIDGAHGGIH